MSRTGQEVTSDANPFSTMTRFHINSGYYLVILYNFRNSCGGLE
ncbi:hypothetical protein E2C01_055777 [Portunus trituberculatus]|uniref:Uncharacterized protein n=1 Tax=Portunus trituberculatus TaxID=210409 RepID=A0A5B7GVN5_PORTR|nr:hypothetical protein [Portunus trituberculatus]